MSMPSWGLNQLTTTFIVAHGLKQAIKLSSPEDVYAAYLGPQITLEPLKHRLHLLAMIAVVAVELNQVRRILVRQQAGKHGALAFVTIFRRTSSRVRRLEAL